MFKFAKKRVVLWPTEIPVPMDDGTGRVDTVTARVRYQLLTQEELETFALEELRDIASTQDLDATLASLSDAAREKRRQRLKEHVVGWEEADFVDERGTPMEVNDANLDSLLSISYLRAAFQAGLVQASRGAPAKNSKPGPGGSPTSTEPVPATANTVN